jgi:hypothetical protein
MRRFTVMGFTEAELGFVVAALFAAIAFATLKDRDASASHVDAARDAAIERDSVIAALEALRERTDAEIASLRGVLGELEKRSTKVPQCWEKGEPREPIGEVAVLGANRYEVQGDGVGANRDERRGGGDGANHEELRRDVADANREELRRDVADANRDDLRREVLDIDGIRRHFAEPIARGNALGCRFVLRARPTDGVSARDHADAVWRLRVHFDVDDRTR